MAPEGEEESLDEDPVAGDEDPVAGDALGVDDPVLLVCTPSFAIVSESSRPLAFRPSAFWNSRSAAFVLGPILPSTDPGSCPLSLSACWIERTCSRFPPFAERDLPDFAPCSAELMPEDDEPAPIDEPVVPDVEPVVPLLLVSVAALPPVPEVPPAAGELPAPDGVEGLAAGADVDDEPPLLVDPFVSVLVPLPLAPGVALPLVPVPDPPLDDCANAGPVTSARAAVSARTLFHEFI